MTKELRSKTLRHLSIQEAARIIRSGGIVVYPTETSYGLGTLAADKKNLKNIYRVKNRDQRKPISILIGQRSELKDWVAEISPMADVLIHHFWPGPLTLVFKAKKGIPHELTAGTGKIGIRISSHPIAQKLCQQVGSAITTTSANRSGGKNCFTPFSVCRSLETSVSGIVSYEKLTRSKNSTILDVSSKEFKVLREGKISIQRIISCLQKEQ